MNAIETKAVTKAFNLGKPNEVRPVNEVSISVKTGECVLLKGPSGSGKTTLLTLLSCLSKPTSGEYLCLGKPVSHWSEKFLTRFRKDHIGIVFQHFNLIKGFTTSQNIGLPLFPLGYTQQEIDAKAKEAAAKVNIDHRLNFKVDTLSGGELQRVAIARALVSNPELLFADEPTAHLDSHNSEGVLEIFADLKSKGKTILMTTHDPIVEQHPMIDRVIEMRDGIVVKH
ncbi:ABC transporter ATP-binding protein [Limibacter armeniacum]|uniref:ABC transporter ATP-binding protein n=1 Tax=Limibacter armeniacum TaxID=466084 RepID=UPI002FE5EC0B